MAEGAGAVGIAALLAGKLKLDGPTALIISGHNVDLDQFLAVARASRSRSAIVSERLTWAISSSSPKTICAAA